MATVIVTDGEERASLAVVRSVGRAGHRVLVCSASGRSLAGASRHAAADHRTPHPMREPEAFSGAVRELAARSEADVLLPVSDAALLALLPEDGPTPGRQIPFGPREAFRALSDKARVWEDACELGLAVPEQVVVAEPGPAPEGLPPGPVVVKPVRSVAGAGGRRARFPVRYATGAEELRAVLDAMDPAGYPVLVQERIRGSGVGLFLLRWKGETRAVFAHRRLREKPPRGGVSVYRESVTAAPELVAACERLLARHDWRGVAMVEFKLESGTGTPYVMEVNPRFWGSLQLAVDAGVDFPRLLVEAALGAPGAPPPAYREGVRTRWWWGDVDHLVARLKGEPPAGSPDGAPARWRALRDFLALWRPGDRWEVLRPDDPMPFVRETGGWLSSLVRGRGDR